MAKERKARKQAKMEEIINAKNKKSKAKKALALVAVGGVAGAFGMWCMMRHNNENDVAGFVLPVDPYQPIGNIDPAVWESIVNNPEYKQQVEQIIKETQTSLTSVQSGANSQISNIVDELNSQFSVSRALEEEITGGYYSNMNNYIRKDNEGFFEFYQRIKYEATQDLPERQQNFIDDVARVYPEKKEYFITHGKEWNFDNFWTYYDYEFSFSEHVEKYPECFRKNEDGSYTQIKDVPLPEGFTQEFMQGVPGEYNTMDVADTWDKLYYSIKTIENTDNFMDSYAQKLPQYRQQEFYDYINELQNAYTSADTQTDTILNNFTSQITDLQNSFANETQNYIGDYLGSAINPTPQDQTLDVDLNSFNNNTPTLDSNIDYATLTSQDVSTPLTQLNPANLTPEVMAGIALSGAVAASIVGTYMIIKNKKQKTSKAEKEEELQL